jgi:hypothetical protein
VSIAYKALIDELLQKVEAGDDLATRCLAALSLVCEGWRYGDSDPSDDPPKGDGESVIDLSAYRRKLAA